MIFAPFAYQQSRVVAAGGGATPTPTPTRTLTPTPTPSTAPANKWNYDDVLTYSTFFDCGFPALYQERTLTFYVYQSNCSTLQYTHPDYSFYYDLDASNGYFSDQVVDVLNGFSLGSVTYTSTDDCNFYSALAVNFRSVNGLVQC
jgi:hypothetical protein